MSADEQRSSSRLPNHDEYSVYKERGFLDPFRVFSSEECVRVVEHFGSADCPPPTTWWKGHAVSDRYVLDLATRDSILQTVKILLGDDVALWGAQLVRKTPRQLHAWHSDVETVHDPHRFASVWIGLENTERNSGLKFASGSHRFGKSIQEIAHVEGIPRDLLTDSEIRDLSLAFDAGSSVVQPRISVGDAVIFAGGLWHASLNTTKTERTALLLQYASTSTEVFIPDHTRLDWPFGFTSVRAPCVLVAGSRSGSSLDFRAPPQR